MRHRTIALPLAVLASLVLASVVVAGGWAQVTAKNVPADPPAGESTTIELGVAQHGVTPVSWPKITVVATNETSGDVVRVAAEAKGPVGSYVATIVFPSEGEWALAFEATGLEVQGSAALRVAAPVVAAPAQAGTPTQAPATAAPATEVMVFVLVLFVLAVGAGILVSKARSRGSSAETRVSAGT